VLYFEEFFFYLNRRYYEIKRFDPSQEANSRLTIQEMSSFFIVTGCSVVCSQKPTTIPCRLSNESSPYLPMFLYQDRC
jgi:hypothetical protein